MTCSKNVSKPPVSLLPIRLIHSETDCDHVTVIVCSNQLFRLLRLLYHNIHVIRTTKQHIPTRNWGGRITLHLMSQVPHLPWSKHQLGVPFYNLPVTNVCGRRHCAFCELSGLEISATNTRFRFLIQPQMRDSLHCAENPTCAMATLLVLCDTLWI